MVIKTNIGSIDRSLRLLLSSVLFYLGLFTFASSTIGTGLVIEGTVVFVTAIVSFCSLYNLPCINPRQSIKYI